MKAGVAFLLGILTILLILLPFYLLSMRYANVGRAWRQIFCEQAV